jgi:hypothetical protein
MLFSATGLRLAGCRFRQLAGARRPDPSSDLVSPHIDRRPSSEVTVGRSDRARDESLSKAELTPVELANKRSVAASARSADELVEVSWLTLWLRIVGAERTTAEEPHRHGGQLRLMTVNELFRLWKPFPHVHRTPDDGRVITLNGLAVFNSSNVNIVASRAQLPSERICNFESAAMSTGNRNEDLHEVPSLHLLKCETAPQPVLWRRQAWALPRAA